ncbi:MAG: type II toxin-antitoxin system RatA family toxin [Magnetospirillum sp.]|nr:type II toxin-antitoxin system RatA family toxin [Magnetospirillum sp.]
MPSIAGRFAADFSAFSCLQLFSLAVDIESYPAFIPWCRRAEIVSRDGNALCVENHFGAGPVDAVFRTRAVAEAPHRLTITSDDAPFRAFQLTWSFTELEGGGCRVAAEYTMALRSPLLHGLAHFAMPEAERKIMRRFRDRAVVLYGRE